MRYVLLIFIVVTQPGCSENHKDLSSVKVGMTAEEVILLAGDPDKKNNIGIAELWTYKKEDRTVVFRKDTVFDVITSADARIDSIKTSLDHLGDKIENQSEKAADKLDDLGRKIKTKAKGDSLSKE
jgi:outer membrane protein assembly factor BamE (lipoprotein component of BamABCDE complex)